MGWSEFYRWDQHDVDRGEVGERQRTIRSCGGTMSFTKMSFVIIWKNTLAVKYLALLYWLSCGICAAYSVSVERFL